MSEKTKVGLWMAVLSAIVTFGGITLTAGEARKTVRDNSVQGKENETAIIILDAVVDTHAVQLSAIHERQNADHDLIEDMNDRQKEMSGDLKELLKRTDWD